MAFSKSHDNYRIDDFPHPRQRTASPSPRGRRKWNLFPRSLGGWLARGLALGEGFIPEDDQTIGPTYHNLHQHWHILYNFNGNSLLNTQVLYNRINDSLVEESEEDMPAETLFTMDTSSIKYGPGAVGEIGYDLSSLGAHRTMLVVDPRLRESETTARALAEMKSSGIDAVVYDGVRVEPTDLSFRQAIEFATAGQFDSFLAIGGGSTMDTAKAANLYSTYPDDFYAYVNAPIGQGKPVPGKLKPMIAIPTTAGTGSETTGTAIFDISERHLKTGIAHRALRPVMGIIDPHTMRTVPAMVVACTGLDVLCHALELLLALPYSLRPAPETPAHRPAYQGANPISQIWATSALDYCRRYLLRAVQDPADEEARGNMLLAAAFAGIGFGNAGVTLPHGMSYPVAGMVRDFHAPDYPTDHAMVPHGMAVSLNAPAVFRFTAPANPAMHLYAAELLGANVRGASPEDAGEVLADTLIGILQKTSMPNGLGALGYGLQDIELLVEGTLPQHRVTKLSPRPASAEDLVGLFTQSLTLW